LSVATLSTNKIVAIRSEDFGRQTCGAGLFLCEVKHALRAAENLSSDQ
jgi:hypothetical protein